MTDLGKIKSAVAYLASRFGPGHRPGKVKLFKLLYLADFTAWTELGRSISTDTYENFEMGPVPVTLWHRFKELTRDCVQVEVVNVGGLPGQIISPSPDFQPDLDDEERAILDRIVDDFGRYSGNQLREYTHKTIPYRATKRGDTIPYGLAAYLNFRKPGQRDVTRLLEDDQLMADLRRALAAAL